LRPVPPAEAAGPRRGGAASGGSQPGTVRHRRPKPMVSLMPFARRPRRAARPASPERELRAAGLRCPLTSRGWPGPLVATVDAEAPSAAARRPRRSQHLDCLGCRGSRAEAQVPLQRRLPSPRATLQPWPARPSHRSVASEPARDGSPAYRPRRSFPVPLPSRSSLAAPFVTAAPSGDAPACPCPSTAPKCGFWTGSGQLAGLATSTVPPGAAPKPKLARSAVRDRRSLGRRASPGLPVRHTGVWLLGWSGSARRSSGLDGPSRCRSRAEARSQRRSRPPLRWVTVRTAPASPPHRNAASRPARPARRSRDLDGSSPWLRECRSTRAAAVVTAEPLGDAPVRPRPSTTPRCGFGAGTDRLAGRPASTVPRGAAPGPRSVRRAARDRRSRERRSGPGLPVHCTGVRLQDRFGSARRSCDLDGSSPWLRECRSTRAAAVVTTGLPGDAPALACPSAAPRCDFRTGSGRLAGHVTSTVPRGTAHGPRSAHRAARDRRSSGRRSGPGLPVRRTGVRLQDRFGSARRSCDLGGCWR
jgi:hypothetical protein